MDPALQQQRRADRVVEINLAPRGLDHRQAGWNLFSMQRRSSEDMEALVAAVVDSFASALRWGEINNRALTLTTMAAKSLVELSARLPPKLAPTLGVAVSQARRRRDHASHQPDRPAGVLQRRQRTAGLVAVQLRHRDCMDAGKIVLACFAGAGDKDRLIANFLVYDVLQGAVSRKDTPPERRRPFYVFFDEVQTYDGASRGNLAALLEQAAKYGADRMLQSHTLAVTASASPSPRGHATTATNAARWPGTRGRPPHQTRGALPQRPSFRAGQTAPLPLCLLRPRDAPAGPESRPPRRARALARNPLPVRPSRGHGRPALAPPPGHRGRGSSTATPPPSNCCPIS